jgi:hypothetical protein
MTLTTSPVNGDTEAVPANVADVVASYVLLCAVMPESEIDFAEMLETVDVEVFCSE